MNVPLNLDRVAWSAKVTRSILRVVVTQAKIGPVKKLVADVMGGPNGLRLADAMSAQPGGAALRARRARLPKHPLSFFAAFPPGSLGRAYHDHLVGAGLDPNDTGWPAGHNDGDWAVSFALDLHDPLHALTGFTASIADEGGLQSFWLAQMPARGSLALLTSGLVQVLFKDWELKDPLLDAIARGWTAGRRAAPYMSYDFEAWWGEPLADVRRRVGLPVEGLGTPSAEAQAFSSANEAKAG